MTGDVTVDGRLTHAEDKLREALRSAGHEGTDKDAQQLATADADFKRQTWADLTAIIDSNRLADLKRVPSDLRRYITWSAATRTLHGSIQTYILKERLGWTLPLTPANPIPFSHPGDTKILTNDWPYGLAPGITHLVCWTKCPIPTIGPGEDGEGDLTPQARYLIQDWVEDTFVERLGKENVLWFKNWASIQSVRSVEHIHILLRTAPKEFLIEILGKEEVERTPIGTLEAQKEEAVKGK